MTVLQPRPAASTSTSPSDRDCDWEWQWIGKPFLRAHQGFVTVLVVLDTYIEV